MRTTAQTRVTHTRRVKLEELEPVARRELETTLATIFLASFVGPSVEEVIESFIYRGPDLRVVLMMNSAQEVVGFTSTSITRYRLGAREHAIFDGGVYSLPGVRGGGAVGMRACFGHALAHRLRHPRMPMASVGLALHPASYRLLCVTLPGFHPRRGVQPSPAVEALVREAAERRKLVPVAADPWVVRRTTLDVRLRDPARSPIPSDEQDSSYYAERNPGYVEGHGMLTYYAFGARNFLSGIARFVTSTKI